MPVVVIAPYDRIFEKTVSNMQEVAARGGKIILITDPKGAAEATVDSLETIILPEMPSTVTPLVYALPGADACLSHGCHHGHRRRPAPEPCEIGHGRITKVQSRASQPTPIFCYNGGGDAAKRGVVVPR